MQLADLNGDGALDLVGYSGSNIVSYINNGNGTFGSAQTTSSGATITHLGVGDIDGDGFADIVATRSGSSSVTTLRGSGSGVFSILSTVSTGGSNVNVATLADMNNDGFADLVSRNAAGNYVIQVGNGNGSFQTGTSYSAGSTGSSRILIQDLNGDGYLDVFGVGTASTGSLLNNGSGGLGSVSAVGDGDAATIADFNHDGVPDIAYISDTDFGAYFATQNRQSSTSIERLNLLSRRNALDALGAISRIQTRVTTELSNLGALQSRLSVAVGVLGSTTEGYETAENRLTNVDVASESANVVRSQILQQASTAVLAQANLSPNLVLGILKQAGSR